MQMKSNMNRRRKEICAGKSTPGIQQFMAVPEKSPQWDNYLCLSTGPAPGILVTVHCVLLAQTGSCQPSQPELAVIRFLHDPCHQLSTNKQTSSVTFLLFP